MNALMLRINHVEREVRKMGIEETNKYLRELIKKYQIKDEKDLEAIYSAISYVRWVKKTSQRIHDIVVNLDIVKNDAEGVQE